jgi:hypothetical protein
MDARTLRTIYTLAAGAIALVIAVLILWLVPEMDPRIKEAVVGIALAAAYAINTWLTNSNPNIASPTVAAVNRTLQTALHNPIVSVSPPKARLERWPTVTRDDPHAEHL